MPQISTHSLVSLSLASAERLCDLAIDAAHHHQTRISVAVVDASGQLLAFRRMDGTILVSIDVSIGKARTAAHIGKPATVFEKMINQGHPALLSISGLTPLAGGLPITSEEAVIGAIGISGASGEVDEAIALQAVRALSTVPS